MAGLSQEFVDYYIACYMAEVTFTDKWIGMFLERLDELGLTDSTVVIFTSDHGTELADRTGLGKRGSEPYPFNTQLNLTIRHPDRSFRNREVHAFTQNHDIAPTILDLTGLAEATEGMQGSSVWPLVTGERSALRDFIVAGWGPHASVRDDRWSYMTAWDEDEPNPRLYDLQADPEEQHNVASERPEVATMMRRRLETYLGGPLPRPKNQDRGGAAGPADKPLYGTSYAPLFYRARMRWTRPGALPT